MKKSALLIMCAALMLLAACTAAPQQSAAPSAPAQTPSTEVSPSAASAKPSAAAQQYIVTASIDSKCIEGNLIKASAKRNLCIYLPPSYYDSDKAYPVVYYLHGHGESVGSYVRSSKITLDNSFKGGAKEFIFVGIDGGTSYYVNSPVTGNWEDYFLTEIIPYVDANYRTIAKAESRGICGFSMGGFGSINLALKHPDVFCAVYSMSPGLLMDDGFGEAMDSWASDRGFLTDYSRAFAPDTAAEKLGDIPVLDGSEEDNIIIEKWMTGFGDLQEKMQAYIALGKPLKAIGFSYGTNDSYTWIPKGTQYFSDLLNENGITNTLFTFKGGHMQPIQGVTKLLIPFFNDNLVYGE